MPQDLIGCRKRRKLKAPSSAERRIDFAVFFIVLWSYGRKICLNMCHGNSENSYGCSYLLRICYFMESECIEELNPSASCWPLTRCILIYQQTGANQNTVHIRTGFIWKFSREWLLWTGYASGGSLRKKPQSPTVKYFNRRKISHRCPRNFQCSQTGCLPSLFVKNKPRKLVSSLVGCLLLFLKIYVLKIGEIAEENIKTTEK